MRLLRRNTVVFQYRARTGEEEVLDGEMHTGNFNPTYAEPVQYRGNISPPSGFATDNLFGINTEYTHILVMDKLNAGIAEDGLVEWNGDTYEVKSVRKSLNVLAVALKQTTKNHTVADDTTEPDGGNDEPTAPDVGNDEPTEPDGNDVTDPGTTGGNDVTDPSTTDGNDVTEPGSTDTEEQTQQTGGGD